jgi:competence protein ComEC
VPITVAIFGQVSIVGPLANALAIPLVSFVVAPLALLGAALACLVPQATGLGDAPLQCARWTFGALSGYLVHLSQWPWASLSLPQPPPAALAVAAGAAWWVVQPRGWPLRGGALAWMVCALRWPVEHPAPGEVWVTALDVGQGMGLVVETEHRVLVFDTGPRFGIDADAGSRVIVPYLRSRGHSLIDLLVISHSDIDHAGGASSLAKEIEVRQTWSSMAPGHPLLAGVPAPVRCQQGQRGTLDELSLTVLSPPAAMYEQPRASTNAHSCVVLLRVGGHGILLTGDVPARQERDMLTWAQASGIDVGVDVLVAPHHGSRSSSSLALLEATRPRWVSMQLGFRNRFGHPANEVVDRYRAQGIAIFRADETGAVRWRLGPGDAIRVEPWRRLHARYWFWHAPSERDGAGAATAAVAARDTSNPVSLNPNDDPVLDLAP